MDRFCDANLSSSGHVLFPPEIAGQGCCLCAGCLCIYDIYGSVEIFFLRYRGSPEKAAAASADPGSSAWVMPCAAWSVGECSCRKSGADHRNGT